MLLHMKCLFYSSECHFCTSKDECMKRRKQLQIVSTHTVKILDHLEKNLSQITRWHDDNLFRAFCIVKQYK